MSKRGFQGKAGILMDVQKLRYFLSIANNLSFTDAGVEMGVSQSAISQQLTELERQIGAQLVIRHKRPLQLTWVGKTLFEEASTLITMFDRAGERIQLAASGKSGSLSIGFISGMEQIILPRVIKEFRSQHPNIFIRLQQYTWTAINDALAAREIDLGFTLAHRLAEYPELIGMSIIKDSLCAAIHQSNPLAGRKMFNLADLKNESFVMFSEETDPLLNELTRQACAEKGFLPKVVNRSRDLSALLIMVETGVGLMLAPGFLRDICRPEIRIVELKAPTACLDVTVARNRSNQNPSISYFNEQLSIYRETAHFRSRSVEKLRLVNVANP